MVPTTRNIAYEILVLSYMNPEDTMSEIASKMVYPPLYIINAMEYGIEMKWFNFDQESDKLINKVVIEDVRGSQLGDSLSRLEEEILEMLERASRKEDDLSEDKLKSWTYNVQPTALEMILFLLEDQRVIVRYELEDPKDKESKYTFIALERNEGKEWGKKQFKVQSDE